MPGFESWWQVMLAFTAAVAAGAVNATAGGGTNIGFPTLVWLGLPPVQANATNAVGLWPGVWSASFSYRDELRALERRWLWLLAPAAIGGGLGAALLIHLPPDWFKAVAPWFVLGSAAFMGLEPLLNKWVNAGRMESRRRLAAGMLVEFILAVYGGYFGAGTGLLMMASLRLIGMRDMHEANALKNFLTIAIEGVSVSYFIVMRRVAWPFALVMLAGSLLGGWVGGRLIRKLDAETLRWIAVDIGVAMGLVLLKGFSG